MGPQLLDRRNERLFAHLLNHKAAGLLSHVIGHGQRVGQDHGFACDQRFQQRMRKGFDDVAALRRQNRRVRPLEILVDVHAFGDDLDSASNAPAFDTLAEFVEQETAPKQDELQLWQPGGGIEQGIDSLQVELILRPRRRCHQQSHLIGERESTSG